MNHNRILIGFASLFVFVFLTNFALGGIIFGNARLGGGSRWDAAPKTIRGNERSLDGGLRYSMQGGSFQAYRDSFSWSGAVPAVVDFRSAVEQAFTAWESVDPVTGLGTDLSFVSDLNTTVVGTRGFGNVNIRGAEIDLLAGNAGDNDPRAVTYFDAVNDNVTLTSGTTNYARSSAISGADISINNNSGAFYTLDFFRRLLTHEIGHAIGLGDVEDANGRRKFIDDNYDPTSPATARATLTNSWALLVNPLNPRLSPGLSIYSVADSNPGIDTGGVDILMESNGLGIAPGNPVTALVPLKNDDYGTRQFLYPSFLHPTFLASSIPEPSTCVLALFGLLGLVVRPMQLRKSQNS